MNDKTEMLHELCRELMKELEDVNQKISRANGMSAGDLETVDKLAHALKSVKTTIAMMESEGDGYSGYYPMRYDGGNSNRYGSSNARGRMNARRDSMGRYSRGDGYSYADGIDSMIEDMEGMLPELPVEKRRKVQRLIDEMRG